MARRLVAAPDAVESLFERLQVRAAENPAWYRLVHASEHARLRYEQVSAPDARGFYHGLLTGYAVAVKALQGKVTAPAQRRR